MCFDYIQPHGIEQSWQVKIFYFSSLDKMRLKIIFNLCDPMVLISYFSPMNLKNINIHFKVTLFVSHIFWDSFSLFRKAQLSLPGDGKM